MSKGTAGYLRKHGLEVDNGSINITDTFKLSGTTVASTAAELNLLDASNTEPADGAFASVLRCAKAEYDFAVDGGAVSAIDLNVDLPDNAIIVSGFIEVITTLTSAGDSATIAIHANSAGDIVAAVAISAATDWDAGIKSIIPVGTGATAIKLTALRAITATIAVQAVTAGKFNVHLFYVIGE
jgi:hypothetical protein